MIAPSSRRWPRVVAESLATVEEPVETLGQPPLPATVDELAAAAAAWLTPGRSWADPPAFLRPEQIDSWRRAHHALLHRGGALLAEPTGSGKSWIALGLAAQERRRCLVVAPAVLLPQWQDVSNRSAVTVDRWSLERLSRGLLPPSSPPLVIIDEAHRLRDPGTRRVHTLAPWLVGRRVLLITASPIVNRLRDLITLLRLIVPEDALALDGIPALGELEGVAGPPVALRRLAIRTAHRLFYARQDATTIVASSAERERSNVAVRAIGSLTLSRERAIRRLLRSVFYDAAASSDAALHRALARYRSLLLHSREAGGISRASIRQFAGEALDQLVLWELIGLERGSELVTSDIPYLDSILAAPQRDEAWIHDLRQHLRSTRPSVCFTRHRATAQLLRRTLGDGTAWVTGSEAGIGPHRLGRALVLSAFGPQRPEWRTRRTLPHVLIATDVAAEGLDLQSAGCVVHIDLPWTAMRLAQREGRLLRIGQRHESVKIIVRRPAAELELLLAGEHRIRRKHALSDQWLSVLERRDADPALPSAPPRVGHFDDGGVDATLVVIATTRGDCAGARTVTRTADGAWCDNEASTAALWQRARGASAVVGSALGVRTALADALRYVLGSSAPRAPTAPALIARIQRLARTAAARRDAASLAALDRLLRFAAAPATLGARSLLERLQDAPDHELLHTRVPDRPRPLPLAARVVAALLFRSTTAPLR